eukprot:1552784-Pleurochrysis_carterae.AAC.1
MPPCVRAANTRKDLPIDLSNSFCVLSAHIALSSVPACRILSSERAKSEDGEFQKMAKSEERARSRQTQCQCQPHASITLITNYITILLLYEDVKKYY